MATYAGTGSVTHAGQGTLRYETVNGKKRVTRVMPNGQEYYAEEGDEKYPQLYQEYVGGLDTNTNATNQLMSNLLNTGSYSYSGGSAPTYTSRYDDQIQSKLDQILNREEFSYDPTTDENYAAYRKEYLREGDRAYRDTMGDLVARTGGSPSSYAVAAASQSRDYYNSQLADKIPELYEAAYNRYLNEYNMNQSDLSALRGLESDDYTKYQTELSQYNTDRQFDYDTWLGDYNIAANNLSLLSSLQDSAYSKAQTEYEKQYNLALLKAEYGDYSGLQALGINIGGTSSSGSSSSSSGTKAASSGSGTVSNTQQAQNTAAATVSSGKIGNQAALLNAQAKNMSESQLINAAADMIDAGTITTDQAVKILLKNGVDSAKILNTIG